MTKPEFMNLLRAMCQEDQYMISTEFVLWAWSFWMYFPDDLPGPDSVEVSQTEADTLLIKWHPLGNVVAVMSFSWPWGEWRIGDQSGKGWKKAVPILRDLLQEKKEASV